MGKHISTSEPVDPSLENLAEEIDAVFIDVYSQLTGVEIDEKGNTAGRSAYDGREKGFWYQDTQADLLYQKMSDASGDWSDGITFSVGELVDDTTPQLGGNLAVNTFKLTSTGNITLKLGDAGGGDKLALQDSANVENFSVNSDGDIETRGEAFFQNPGDVGNDYLHIRQTGLTYIDSYSNSIGYIELNPRPTNGTSNAFVRHHRRTNTTGNVATEFYIGNDSSTKNHELFHNNALDSYFCGNNGTLTVGASTNGSNQMVNVNGAVAPHVDDTFDLGTASRRWDDVRATNATIQTSDENLKTDIAELEKAEIRAAARCKGLVRKFRWKSSKEEKGEGARYHVGMIAQDVAAALKEEGLDPERYAFFIKDVWWEAEVVEETWLEDEETGKPVEKVVHRYIRSFETEEAAGKGAVRRERLGLRYSELLAFIISAM